MGEEKRSSRLMASSARVSSSHHHKADQPLERTFLASARRQINHGAGKTAATSAGRASWLFPLVSRSPVVGGSISGEATYAGASFGPVTPPPKRLSLSVSPSPSSHMQDVRTYVRTYACLCRLKRNEREPMLGFWGRHRLPRAGLYKRRGDVGCGARRRSLIAQVSTERRRSSRPSLLGDLRWAEWEGREGCSGRAVGRTLSDAEPGCVDSPYWCGGPGRNRSESAAASDTPHRHHHRCQRQRCHLGTAPSMRDYAARSWS